MEVKCFLTELILQKIIINLLCPLTIHQKIKIPFSKFPCEHQPPIDYTDFELEVFSSWLNDTDPGDNYENTNNVLIAGSENQNMTNMEQLRNFRSFVDIVLGFARLLLYSAKRSLEKNRDC